MLGFSAVRLLRLGRLILNYVLIVVTVVANRLVLPPRRRARRG
jgi:hypothetical protein